jgi:hypothetical protein
MKWRLLQSAFKFGCDRALHQEFAQPAGGRADEFKADICELRRGVRIAAVMAQTKPPGDALPGGANHIDVSDS